MLTAVMETARITETHAELDSGRFYVQGLIDGEPESFQLDSGSTYTSVAFSDFTARYPTSGSRRRTGAAGASRVDDLITIAQLRIGEREILDHPVVRYPKGSESESRVGMDALAARRLCFDFKSGVLRFNPHASETLDHKLTRLAGGVLGMNASVGDLRMEAAWDTGAELTVVDTALVQHHPDLFRFVEDVQGEDSTETRLPFRVHRAMRIMLGDHEFDEPVVLAMDLELLRRRLGNLQLVVGFNLMRNLAWSFDVESGRWGILKTVDRSS